MANNHQQRNHQHSVAKKKHPFVQESKSDNAETKSSDNGDSIEVEGVVEDILGFGNYSVMLTDIGMKVIAYASGKMNKNKISIIQGDKVRIELNPLDPTKGRIVYRQK